MAGGSGSVGGGDGEGLGDGDGDGDGDGLGEGLESGVVWVGVSGGAEVGVSGDGGGPALTCASSAQADSDTASAAIRAMGLILMGGVSSGAVYT